LARRAANRSSKKLNERELQPLALESYRHFALKKMLAKLPAL
jgi:hypothetical protein